MGGKTGSKLPFFIKPMLFAENFYDFWSFFSVIVKTFLDNRKSFQYIKQYSASIVKHLKLKDFLMMKTLDE